MPTRSRSGPVNRSPDIRQVVILSPAFPPWGGGGVIRMAKLAKYLPERGWSVTVIASDERSPVLLDESLAQDLAGRVDIVSIRGPLNKIGGSATGAVAGAWRSGRMRNAIGAVIAAGRSVIVPDRWIGWALAASRQDLPRLGAVDVVLSSGPPHSAHLAGVILAGRLGVPLVVDLRDDWAGNPFGRNVGPWQPIANRRLEGWAGRSDGPLASSSCRSICEVPLLAVDRRSQAASA
jgi:hypothetical protein